MYFFTQTQKEDITFMMARLGSLVTISFGSKVGIPEEGYNVDHLKDSSSSDWLVLSCQVSKEKFIDLI